MPELNYKPVTHDHKAFLARASKRKGFIEAYQARALEYQALPQCNDGDSQEICDDDKA